MGCGCDKRRALTAQALKNLKSGNTAAAKSNMNRFVASTRSDLRKIGSAIGLRPQVRR